MHAESENVKLLVLLNPGRTSRRYMQGIARGAESLGILGATLELGDVWAELRNGEGALAQARAAASVRDLCERRGITHVIGYTHNGVFDFGPRPDPEGTGAPVGLFTEMGLTHILLWTDHPNWAVQASALRPSPARTLSHPNMLHLVKSQGAAAEIRDVLGWDRTSAIDMAEDPDDLRPARDVDPVHDAVIIQSDASAPPGELLRFLDSDDPCPAAMMRALEPGVISALRTSMESLDAGAGLLGSVAACARDLIERKIQQPLVCMHTLAAGVRDEHPEALAWLKSDPQRWFAFVGSLGGLASWRRSFWPVWLSRRVNVGVYGTGSGSMGLEGESSAHEGWVEYDEQPEIYARGRVAININAAHDEEGLTHKPFQIGASASACVHHATRGLERCFDPGEDAMVFERGPELLEAVRALGADSQRRSEIADSMRERVRTEHTWAARLEELFGARHLAIGSGGPALESAA